MKKILALLMALVCMMSLVLCGCTDNNADVSATDANVTDAVTEAVTDDATQEQNAQITLTIDVVDADGNTETFTVNTDADNLGDALVQDGLVEGEMSTYGLYIKTVNGIRADYDLDKAYWALYSDGEMLMTGASDTAIADGQHYELVYTAG